MQIVKAIYFGLTALSRAVRRLHSVGGGAPINFGRRWHRFGYQYKLMATIVYV